MIPEIPEHSPITHVAIRFRGQVYSLPAPNRHHDVIRMIVTTTDATYVDVHHEDQGFLDAHGTYLNRKQALYRATRCDQIKDASKVRANELTSEDVW